MPLLKAIGLSHSYGKFQVLSMMEVALEPGEITVLEGPNGSGKSTLLQCLSGVLSPTTGEIRVNGYDIQTDEPEAKRALAFAPDVPRFYTELTAWEHLRFLALIHGAGVGFEDRAEALLREFGLWEARRRAAAPFFVGDEPETWTALCAHPPFPGALAGRTHIGAGPGEQQAADPAFDRGRKGGAAIMLSSHDPELKAGLADRVLLMRRGHLHAA